MVFLEGLWLEKAQSEKRFVVGGADRGWTDETASAGEVLSPPWYMCQWVLQVSELMGSAGLQFSTSLSQPLSGL